MHSTRDYPDRYGPTLEDYLKPNMHIHKLAVSTSIRHLPSRLDLLNAISTLSEPESVTYKTFETILALECNPICHNIDLVFSDAAQSTLPACFRLLRMYLQESNGRILDYAYGFLCIRVIGLFVQFAQLSPSQTNSLSRLLVTTLELPWGRSIAEELDIFSCDPTMNLVEAWMESRDDEDDLASRLELFGWRYDPTTGDQVCLSEVGGCKSSDILYLLDELWKSRDQLFCVLNWTLDPCMVRLLCWIWTGIVQEYGENNITEMPDSKPFWIKLLDLVLRFMSSSIQRRTLVISYLPIFIPLYGTEPILLLNTMSAVDSRDSQQIGKSILKQLRADFTLPIDVVTALLAFASRNINYQGNTADIYVITFKRLGSELQKVTEMNKEVVDLIECGEVCMQILQTMLKCELKSAIRMLDTIGEDLYEVIGRLLFLPVLPYELNAIAADSIEFLCRLVRKMGPRTEEEYKEYNNAIALFPGYTDRVFPIWSKIFIHLDFLVFSRPNSSQEEWSYCFSWLKAWLEFGQLVPIDEAGGRAIYCGYPRCPLPSNWLAFECTKCHGRRYCSLKCQQADWDYSIDPHGPQCEAMEATQTHS